jgi:hypothetical protein
MPTGSSEFRRSASSLPQPTMLRSIDESGGRKRRSKTAGMVLCAASLVTLAAISILDVALPAQSSLSMDAFGCRLYRNTTLTPSERGPTWLHHLNASPGDPVWGSAGVRLGTRSYEIVWDQLLYKQVIPAPSVRQEYIDDGIADAPRPN